MCNLFLKFVPAAKKGEYQLILASNRDEHLRRPTTKAQFWDDHTSVIGGRDAQPGCEGGTWLAMSKEGIIGVLLNVKGVLSTPAKLSRGPIVENLVKTKSRVEYHLDKLGLEADRYNAFQLVTISLRPQNPSVVYLTNHVVKRVSFDDTPDVAFYGTKPQEIKSTIFSVGNGTLKSPFKKTEMGQLKFENIVKKYGKPDSREILVDSLLSLLKCREPHYPDNNIDILCPEYSDEQKLQYSSLFIDIPRFEFGTRAHTIILVDAEGYVEFFEWSLLPNKETKQLEWLFTWEDFQIDYTVLADKPV